LKKESGIAMDNRIKTELDNIIGALTRTGIVSQIILFGSYAKGEERPGSDIDLCVLTPVGDKHPIDITVDFKTKLYGVKTMPLDLIAYNKDVFWYHAGRPTSFEHEIAETGVTIYGKNWGIDRREAPAPQKKIKKYLTSDSP